MPDLTEVKISQPLQEKLLSEGIATGKIKDPMAVKLDRFFVERKGSPAALLVTDTSIATFNITWRPEFWLIVPRGTAGYLIAYPSASRSTIQFRLNTGMIRAPIPTDTWTIETVGFSGFYDLYACKGIEGLEIQS